MVPEFKPLPVIAVIAVIERKPRLFNLASPPILRRLLETLAPASADVDS